MPSVLAVFFYKGTSSEMDGVSTYLALTFGTLLSSQGTDTSFGPPSSGPSGRFALSCFQLIRCLPLRFPESVSSDLLLPFGTPELYQSSFTGFTVSN